MTVKELIERLSKEDQDLRVVIGNDYTAGVRDFAISEEAEDVSEVGKCLILTETEVLNPDEDC